MEVDVVGDDAGDLGAGHAREVRCQRTGAFIADLMDGTLE
jgi:hypothetical protein